MGRSIFSYVQSSLQLTVASWSPRVQSADIYDVIWNYNFNQLMHTTRFVITILKNRVIFQATYKIKWIGHASITRCEIKACSQGRKIYERKIVGSESEGWGRRLLARRRFTNPPGPTLSDDEMTKKAIYIHKCLFYFIYFIG